MEEIVEKRVEIKGIGFLSTFKLFFGMFMIMSLLIFLSVQLFGQELLIIIGNFTSGSVNFINQLLMKFPIVVTNPIIGSLVFSMLYGFFMAVFFSISAGIYTVFALLLGGVSIKIKEKAEVSTPFK
jgi:hypothetical protein